MNNIKPVLKEQTNKIEETFNQSKLFELIRPIANFRSPLNYIVYMVLFTIVLMMVLIIRDTISLISLINKSRKVNEPLINETLEYNLARSVDFFKFRRFNLWIYIVLPILSVIGLIYVITQSRYDIPAESKISVIWLLVLNLLLIFGFGFVFYTNVKKIKIVQSRLTKCNKFICNNIYKNNQVLDLLSKPKTSITEVRSVMRDIIQGLDPEIDTDSLSRLLYTLNIYNNFYNIGMNNPQIKDALNTLNPLRIITNRCDPANYFFRYGTYIEDINHELVKYLDKEISDSQSLMEKVKRAMIKCYGMVTETNNLVNNIYIEDAYTPFIEMYYVILRILLALLVMSIYLFIKKNKT